MKSFQDSAGRTWQIGLTLGSAMRLKDELGIDILQPEEGDPPLMVRFGTDEILLGQIVCSLLSDQLEKADLTESGLKDAFDGPTILAAQRALYEELADFFRSRGRTDRARAIGAQGTLIAKSVQAAETKIAAVDLDSLTDSIHGGPSGSSPGSPESSPST